MKFDAIGFAHIRNVFGFLSLYRKKPVLLRTGLPTWQRAIFTGARPAIVAAEVLNFCVRDGTGVSTSLSSPDRLRSLPQN